jgi:glucokinase
MLMNQKTRNRKKALNELALGVDLGGSKIETVLIDKKCRILSSCKHVTSPEKGPDGVVEEIVNSVNLCIGKKNLKPLVLGIGVAGQTDSAGAVVYAPNLDWHNVPLAKKIEEKLGIPTKVTNDVRAAAYGEWIYGSGRGIDDLVVLFVGTGIGGGIVTGGKMVVGCNNAAGELGHTTIVAGGRRCHCNNLGCLEAYASGWAIAQRTQEAVKANPELGQTLIPLAGSSEKITAQTLAEAYHKEDRLARILVEDTSRYLAAGVVSIVNIFDPYYIVLGGGVIEGIPELIKAAENIVRTYALKASLKNLTFAKASFGDKAGAIGAAAFAQKTVLTKHQT